LLPVTGPVAVSVTPGGHFGFGGETLLDHLPLIIPSALWFNTTSMLNSAKNRSVLVQRPLTLCVDGCVSGGPHAETTTTSAQA
jgi:hypothetical protein